MFLFCSGASVFPLLPSLLAAFFSFLPPLLPVRCSFLVRVTLGFSRSFSSQDPKQSHMPTGIVAQGPSDHRVLKSSRSKPSRPTGSRVFDGSGA